jgi:hypothetical protein
MDNFNDYLLKCDEKFSEKIGKKIKFLYSELDKSYKELEDAYKDFKSHFEIKEGEN